MTPYRLFPAVMFLLLIFENMDMIVCPKRTITSSSSSGDHQKRKLEKGQSSTGRGAPARSGSTSGSHTSSSRSRSPSPEMLSEEEVEAGFQRLRAPEPTTIQMHIFFGIQATLRNTVVSDQCACGSNFAFPRGKQDCLAALVQFQSLPSGMKGERCRGAFHANCYKPPGSNAPRRCHFYLKTTPGETRPVDGFWRPLSECANDLHNYDYLRPDTTSPSSSGSSGSPRGIGDFDSIAFEDDD